MRKRFFIFFLCLLPAAMLRAQADPVPRVKFVTVGLDGDSALCWSAKEVINPYVYIMQQFRWNRWVDWDTLSRTPGKDTAKYCMPFRKYLVNGENKFRVRAAGEGILVYSKAVNVSAEKEEAHKPRHRYSDKNTVIDFGKEACYEIYDKDGKLLKKGCSKTVDVKELPEGNYFLNYDEVSTDFTKG